MWRDSTTDSRVRSPARRRGASEFQLRKAGQPALVTTILQNDA
jgi:hypothetical protein